MCDSPNILRDGNLVACRKCSQCRDFRVQTWVGRCIAESKTAFATTTIELTYGRDENGNESHPRAAILTYSDVQKYFKQLRKRGFPARYLITGEMGSKKGRAHWHGIVFWQKAIPTSMLDYGNNSWHRAKRPYPVDVPIEWETRFNEPCWVHGFSWWQTVQKGREKGSIMYACKYLQKDLDDPASQSKLVMSKRPPIGAEYFVERAQKFVDEGIAPQDGLYAFPMEAKQKSGKPISFMLRGKLKEIFCQAFIDKWAEQGRGHPPASEYIEEFQDRKLRKESGDYEYVGANRFIRMPAKSVNLKETACQTDETIDVENQIRRLQVENKHDPKPQLTQLGWVEKLSESQTVFWISLSAPIGRYRLAKDQPATGLRVWLLSTAQ